MTRIRNLFVRWIGHPHRCAECGVPGWCTGCDETAVTCGDCQTDA